MSSNPFLDLLKRAAPEVLEEEENPFLSQLVDQEEEQSSEPWYMKAHRKIEKFPKGIPDLAKKIIKKQGRMGMQGAIGLAKGKLLTSAAGVPAVLAEIATPGAIEESLREEETFERDLPTSIRNALGLPEYKPEVAREASKQMYNKLTGGKGLIEGAITAPFRLAGIETEPESGWEGAVRNVSELFMGMMNPKEAAALIFDHLPTAAKSFFKDKLGQIEEMLIGNLPMNKTIFESAESILQGLTEEEVPRSLHGRISAVSGEKGRAQDVLSSGRTPRIRPETPQPAPSLGERITSGEDIGIRPRTEPPFQVLRERITPGEDIGLRPQAIGRETKPTGIQMPQPGEMPAESLAGRVTERGTRLRALSPQMQQTLEPIGQIVSPVRFVNDEVASNTFRQIIQNDAAVGRDVIRDAYELAEQEYNHVIDAYPQLVNRIQTLRESLIESGSLNPAQQAVVRELDNILGMIATPEGESIAVPVRRLIRTSDSITGRLTQDDIYGDAKTLLRGVGHDLNQAALQAVERSGGNTEAIVNADRIYAQWADRFSNDEVAPFLTRRTFNPEAEYKKAVSDRGSFRALENAIGDTPQGQAAISSLERDIVEKELEPFIKDPEKIGSRQYEKVIENLRPIIGNDRVTAIEERLSATRTAHAERKMPKREIKVEAPKKPFTAERKEIGSTGKVPIPKAPEVKAPFKAERKEIGGTGKVPIPKAPEPVPPFKAGRKPIGKTAVPRPEVKPTTSQYITAKYLDKQPEDIQKMLSSRSGMRELKKDLVAKKGKAGERMYDIITRQKVRSILREGGIHKHFTGKKLYKILNDEKNFEIISEVVGKERTEEALELAKGHPNIDLTTAYIKKIGKYYLASEFLKHAFPILRGHQS